MSEQNNTKSSGSESAKPARKRRGLWWKIPVALVVLLVLLVLLLPTIASTSPVRSYALTKINASMPGKLEVTDWSFGWFSGASVQGISYTDEKGHKMVEVSGVATPVTLLQLARMNLHMGEIVIPEVTMDIVVPMAEAQKAPAGGTAGVGVGGSGESGGSGGATGQTAGTTFPMPDASASLKIQHIGGKLTILGKDGKSATLALDKASSLQVDLPQGGSSAKCDVNLVVAQPGAAGPANVAVNVAVDGLKPGTVDYMQLTGQVQVKVSGLDLDQVAGLARVRGTELGVKGILSGQIDASVAPGGGPAKCDVNLVLTQPGAAAPATIGVSATVNGLKAGAVDVSQLTGQAQVKVSGLDLGQVAGLAGAQGAELGMKGILSGQIDASMPRPMEGTVKGEFAATDVEAMLGKDQIVTKQLRIPIDVALSGQGDALRVAIKQLGVLLDQANVNITGDLPVASLKQFGNGQEVAQDGAVKVSVDVPDLAVVLNTLRNTVKLQQGVQVLSGRLDLQVNAALGKGGLRVQAPISLRDLAAVQDGKKIGPLQPLMVEAGATIPNARAGVGDVRNLAVNITSSFLTLSAKGSTIYATNAQGECDLVKLRDDLGSIVDLSMIRGGKLTLNVVNRQPEANAMESTVRVQLTGVGVNLPAAQAAVAGVAAQPRRLEDANVLIAVRTLLRDNMLAINEPARIEASGRLLEGAPGQAAKVLLDQAATIIMSGSFQTQEKRLHLTSLSVTAGKDKPVAQISLPDGATADLAMSGKRGVSGAVKLAVRADLAALQAIGQRFSGTMPVPGQGSSADGLKSGMFIGNVSAEITPEGGLKVAMADSSLDFEYIASAKSYRDRVALAATADVSGDNTKIGASVSAKGKMIDLATKAQLVMATGADGTQGLKEIRVDQLDGKTDFAEVSLTQPVVVSDMPALMAALAGKEVPAGVQIGGALLLKADIAKVMALAGQSQASADAYSISGMLTAKPKIALVQKSLVVDVNSQIEPLKVAQGAKTVVAEPKLTIGGHVSVNPTAKLLEVDPVTISSSSGLLDMKATLRVVQYGTANKLENGVVDLTPDLGKIWSIIYAMMPPATQQSIGELVVAGKKTSHIVIGGSFPTDKPYGEAVKLVTVAGDFAIENVNYKKYGVTLSGAIPFSLKGGIIHFAYPDKATPPLVCNKGTIDLSKVSIDLAGTDPRLSIEPKAAIVSNLQLNSVMVSSLGEYLAPVFSGATGSTQGSVDLSSEKCDRLPLSQLMLSAAPANDGAAQFFVNINGLEANSSELGGILGLISGGKSGQSTALAGDIKQASVAIAKGHCTQKLALPINGTAVPMDGDLRLADNYYIYLKFGLPREFAAPLLSKSAGVKLAADDLPPTLDVSFSGPVNNLKLNTDIKALVASIAKQQLQKRVLGGLLGQPNTTAAQGGQATSQPPAQKQPGATDAVGGLLDMFGGKKK